MPANQSPRPNPLQVAAVEGAAAEMTASVFDDPSFDDLPREVVGEMVLAAVCGELLMRGLDIRAALATNFEMADDPSVVARARAAGGPQKGADPDSGAIPPATS